MAVTRSNGVFRYRANQPVVWFHEQPSRSNCCCLYCGAYVGPGSNRPSNKEHLIGKDFTPSGMFDGGKGFNFIFRACEECNSRKGDVERHVSSITLFTSPARSELPHIDAIASRKASNDYHPDKHGTRVRDAVEEQRITAGKYLSFGLVAPPQLNRRYAEVLACRHIQGFFSLVTTTNPLQAINWLNPEYLFAFGVFNHRDWGNPQLLAITERVREWPCYVNISTAQGFFKAIMRRHRGDRAEWFWALEWNKSVRVFGGISQPDNTPGIFLDLPALTWNDLGVQDGAHTRFREEIPLDGKVDILFEAEVVSVESDDRQPPK